MQITDRHILFSVVFAVFIFCLCMTYPAVSSAVEFSATMTTESDEYTVTSKVYYNGDKQRTEPEDEDQGIVIVRQDKKLVWVLMPSDETYMEMPVTEQYANPLTSKPAVVSRKPLGGDTVDGRDTEKELVTVRNSDGTTDTMYQWTDRELGIPIKAEDVDGEWSYEYTDIEVGRQDPELFEVPDDYEKMSMNYRPGYYPEPDYPEPPVYPDYPEPPGVPTPW